MPIAGNHIQFILEVALILHIGVMFLLNIVPLSLSMVVLFMLVLSVGLSFIFGFDSLFLILPGFSHSEFTHPFGPIALLAVVSVLAALPMMKKAGVNVRSLRLFIILIMIFITIAGGLMHRSFLVLWFLGLLIGFFIISKSFRQKSVFTIKRIIAVGILVIAGFGSLELISRILEMPVFSPLLRISRIEQFSVPSIKLVLQHANLWGHTQGSCFWGQECLGGSDGYISLPISLITFFSLPYPLFYGILVTKKDVIDYMLPGIFGITFDFGYLILILVLGWTILVLYTGFTILRDYQRRREDGDKSCLGREALLIGSLTAFIAQALVGMFIMNRSINGTALLTFIFLSALVMGHIMIRKNPR